MDRENLVRLTNELYRLTLLFPKKEPLRYKMREIADDILSKCLIYDIKQRGSVSAELKVLDSFFEVAKAQNWVKPEELLKVKESYIKLGQEVEEDKKEIEAAKETMETKGIKTEMVVSLDKGFRQQKILTLLKERGQAQVGELKAVFPEVSKRTLRRDFENLLKQGIIQRMGERNDTFYRTVS